MRQAGRYLPEYRAVVAVAPACRDPVPPPRGHGPSPFAKEIARFCLCSFTPLFAHVHSGSIAILHTAIPKAHTGEARGETRSCPEKNLNRPLATKRDARS